MFPFRCYALLLAALLLLGRGSSESPGPKSGLVHALPTNSWPRSSLTLGLIQSLCSDQRGEGSASPMACREGADNQNMTIRPPKSHGTGQGVSHGTKPISKRSYCRALRRVRETGWTFYRGRLMIGSDISSQSTMKPPSPPLRPLARRRAQPRACMLNWNVGGLTTPLYHEILHWLSKHRIDICTMQGVRWTGDRTWTAGGFSFIQNGDPDGGNQGHSGLITVISHSFCHFEQISFGCVVPGRLLHVKCQIGAISCDIFNCYQHPLHVTTNRPDPLASRAAIWNAIDAALCRVPFRNILVLGGDFNCDPKPCQATYSAYPDVLEFQELIKKYSLASVRTHDSQPSFIGPNGHANIDFILMRQCQLDGEARRGHCVTDFPLASWRQMPDHLPIVTSFPTGWKCWYQPSEKFSFSRRMQEKVAEAQKLNTPTWQTYVSQATDRVAQLQVETPDVQTLLHWSEEFCKKHFVLQPKLPHASQSTKHIVHQLWDLRRELCATTNASVQALFTAWQTHTQLHKKKKQLDRHCRAIKLNRIHQAVTAAEQAASNHDTRKLFATIRTLCPKHCSATIRFRGEHGQAMTGVEESQHLAAYLSEVFDSAGQEPTVPEHCLSHLPFDIHELQDAFEHAGVHKAVGPHALPNIFVRALASPLAQWTYATLQQLWLHKPFQVPQHWKDAWLTLLAKRTVKSPRDLRPIALTDSIGKLVLGILTTKLRNQLRPTLVTLPLFAYLPGRTTSDALMFVFDHCRQVREHCQEATSSYWERRANKPKPKLCGGLMMSLDLSQAFDRLPRDLLAEGFASLVPDSEVAPLLLHWLTEARYHITHRGIHSTIPTTRGVRQGCKASPLEWTVFLCAFFLRLDLALWHETQLWTLQHLITYADDLIARWKIETSSDLQNCIHQISILLDTLEQVGMTVNLTKTVILVRLEGSKKKAVWKQHVDYVHNRPFLCVPCAKGIVRIPIVQEHVYLGTKISYYNFEDRTLQHRLHISRVTFLRLRPVLTGRKALPLALRLRLWIACIRSSALHGLEAAGLTSAGSQQLHRRFVKDLRNIARSPSHITRETTQALFQRLGIPLPLEHLISTWKQNAARKAEHLAGLTTFDFLARFDFSSHYAKILHVLEADAQQPAPAQDLFCMYCHFVTETQTFQMLRDAWQGHPQCRHCNRKFPSLRNLRRHISQNNCMHFDAHCSWQEPAS